MTHELDAQTDSSKYNAGTKRAQLIHEEYNAARNYQVIIDAIAAGRARDINDEPKRNGEPVIIVGSGASLDLALPLLKDWKGGLICTTSHALTLVKYGAPPTHIFALDPFCTWAEIDGVDWSQYGTKLITTPTVWPTLIHTWPNEILLYRQNMGRKDTYYATTLNHMYSERETEPGSLRMGRFNSLIRTEVTLFACSPPGQLFAAQVLGYGNVFLSGCDFGYTYGKDRFTNWTVENGEWVAHENPIVPDRDTVVTASGITTHPVHLYYKKNMLSAWRLSMQDVWTTDRGTITEMPYVDMAHVIEKQGRHIKGFSPEEKRKASEEYLAMVGAFVLESDCGYTFVESKDPDAELTRYMTAMNRQYACKCGASISSEDDGDKTGVACPACGQPIFRPAYADIEANMTRIHERLKGAEKLRKEIQDAAEKGKVKEGDL